MLSLGKLPQSGLIRQEDIQLPAFLANPLRAMLRDGRAGGRQRAA